jgi:hypothetical protein
MKSWGEYVLWRRQTIGNSSNTIARIELDGQEADVKQLYTPYRTAMDSFYEARALAGNNREALKAACAEPLARAQTAAGQMCALAQSLAMTNTPSAR